MKFTVSTKPLDEALGLSIVNGNISNYYLRSTLAEITLGTSTLQINLEAASIVSEVTLKGSGELSGPADTRSKICVDCRLLKQLISTFENPVTVFEITESALILHSGKSKFTLPSCGGEEGEGLNTPSELSDNSDIIELKKSDWKFVKDSQMYALAMSLIKPIYTYVWCGESGDVLVGDFENSLFTQSKKNNLGTTCLLSSTIINLFNNLPEGAKLVKLGTSYGVSVSTDSYTFVSEFTPKYEGDEGVGTYNSEIILGAMKAHSGITIKLKVDKINKSLSQADILATTTESTIKVFLADNLFTLTDSNIECKVDVDYSGEPYSANFRTDRLKSVFSNCPDEEVEIALITSEDQLDGIVVTNKDVSIMIAGEE